MSDPVTQRGVTASEMPPIVPLPIKTVGKRFKYWIALTNDRRFVFDKDWVHRISTGELICIPEGTEIDGASFPWWLPAALILLGALSLPYWALIPWLLLVSAMSRLILSAIGVALIAGALHDFLFANHYLPLTDGRKFMAGCTRWEADDMFKREHIHSNDMLLLAWATWRALRLGSWYPWNKYRKIISLEPDA